MNQKKKNRNKVQASVNEPEVVYSASPKEELIFAPNDYMTADEFWKKVEEKRKNFCLKNDLV